MTTANPPLRDIQLHGALRSRFGRKFRLSVSSVAEAVHALGQQIPGFTEFLMKSRDRGLAYKVYVDKNNIGEDELTMLSKGIIRIVPVLLAAKNQGIFQIILGTALVLVGSFFTVFTAGLSAGLVSLGYSMILGGIVQLLSPTPKDPKSKDKDPPNYAFNGPVNTTAQGYPVPVLYGKMITGSAVVSAGISNDIPTVVAPSTASFVFGGYALEMHRTTDGVNFTHISLPSGMSDTIRYMTANGNTVLGTSYSGYIYRSYDAGQTWERLGYQAWSGGRIVYGNGRWVATGGVGGGGYGGPTGTMISTDDGDTWTSSAPFHSGFENDLAYGNGVFLFANGGYYTSNLYRSTDGLNWTVVNGNEYSSIEHNGSVWMGTLSGGYAQWSLDGTVWNSCTGTTYGTARLAGFPGGFLAVTTGGCVYKTNSYGDNFVLKYGPEARSFYTVAIRDHIAFASTGGGGSLGVMVSLDYGETWAAVPPADVNFNVDIVFAGY